jgi:hypothetical protein
MLQPEHLQGAILILFHKNIVKTTQKMPISSIKLPLTHHQRDHQAGVLPHYIDKKNKVKTSKQKISSACGWKLQQYQPHGIDCH